LTRLRIGYNNMRLISKYFYAEWAARNVLRFRP
jgi:hypothetical protein